CVRTAIHFRVQLVCQLSQLCFVSIDEGLIEVAVGGQVRHNAVEERFCCADGVLAQAHTLQTAQSFIASRQSNMGRQVLVVAHCAGNGQQRRGGYHQSTQVLQLVSTDQNIATA